MLTLIFPSFYVGVGHRNIQYKYNWWHDRNTEWSILWYTNDKNRHHQVNESQLQGNRNNITIFLMLLFNKVGHACQTSVVSYDQPFNSVPYVSASTNTCTSTHKTTKTTNLVSLTWAWYTVQGTLWCCVL